MDLTRSVRIAQPQTTSTRSSEAPSSQPSSRAADQVRTYRKPEYGEGIGVKYFAYTARQRRRSDRIAGLASLSAVARGTVISRCQPVPGRNSFLLSEQMQLRHIREFDHVTIAQQGFALDDALDLGPDAVMLAHAPHPHYTR